MNFVFYFAVFVAGAFIGSFLNVVVDRYRTKESIMWGRSHCDSCRTTLVAKDLIPIFSYFSLGGSCRYCGKKFSFYYPLSEFLTGVMFVLVAYYSQVFSGMSALSWLFFLFFAVVISIYIVVFLSDLKYRIVPNNAILFGVIFVTLFIVGTIGYAAISSYTKLKNDDFGKYLIESGYWADVYINVLKQAGVRFLSAFGLSLFFAFLIFITKGRGMGWGDVKLAFLIGIVNGFPYNIVAIFLGFLLGAVFSVLLVILKKKTIKDTIPFGPFMVLGSILSQVYGSLLIDWYFNLF